LDQLNGLIDNELTQVIGDANFLKDSKEAILDMFKLFSANPERLFDKLREDDFKSKISTFDEHHRSLETRIESNIKKEFSSVRSSIEKFIMLEKFNVLKDKKVLQNKINDNFSEVLDSYTENELKNYESLFHKYKDNVPVSDNIPCYARKLIWALQL